jgi:hypothetical protein
MNTTPFQHESVYFLQQRVALLESYIISGIATDQDIDSYVNAQLILATRSELEFLLDPRD